MRKGLSVERELFILHADAAEDTRFVHGYLVPSLSLGRQQFLLSSSLPAGRPFLETIEHALCTSRVTVLVMSPAFLRETWVFFSELLAIHHAIGGGVLVPMLIADCAVPRRLELWVRLDFRSPEERPHELARLRELLALPGAAPPPAAAAAPAAKPAPQPEPTLVLAPDPHLETVWRLHLDISRPRALMIGAVVALLVIVRATAPEARSGARPTPHIADVQLRASTSASVSASASIAEVNLCEAFGADFAFALPARPSKQH